MRKKLKWIIPVSLIFILLVTGVLLLTEDYFIKKAYWKKIWVHRVNSKEKLREVNHQFTGVEVDLDYIDSLNVFDVNHPPAESIGLSLYEYLKANDNPNLMFWLDMKNLNTQNAQQEFTRLVQITQSLGYKPQRFIVESESPEALSLFSDYGFKTSYYLHYPGIYTLKGKEQGDYIKYLSRQIEAHPTKYLSSPWWDYQILKEHFPNKEKLLWFAVAELKFSNPVSKHLYRLKVAKDPKVQVILMDINTKAKFR